MALNADAKITNIKRSLDNYVKTCLGTSAALSVDYEGLPFDEKNVGEWIQPRLVDASPYYYRQGSNSQYGEDVCVLYQINIFAKKSGVTTTDKHYAIRDKILDYFKVGQDITINDWDNDGTAINKMRIRELTNDSPLPEKQETYQYMLSWEMNYTRLTTNPS